MAIQPTSRLNNAKWLFSRPVGRIAFAFIVSFWFITTRTLHGYCCMQYPCTNPRNSNIELSGSRKLKVSKQQVYQKFSVSLKTPYNICLFLLVTHVCVNIWNLKGKKENNLPCKPSTSDFVDQSCQKFLPWQQKGYRCYVWTNPGTRHPISISHLRKLDG